MLKDDRMKVLADKVRAGVTVCDVGTDHAIIPIELIKSGKTPVCIITDISLPSLQKGIKNARDAGCEDRIIPYCTNGTVGAELETEMDIIIAGMGGELITEIMEQDSRLKNCKYRFILQPMSKAEHLRKYLADYGYEILSESKAESGGRIYAVICCGYTGEKYIISETELMFGKLSEKPSLPEIKYCANVIKVLKVKLAGMESGSGSDIAELKKLRALISELERKLNEICGKQ